MTNAPSFSFCCVYSQVLHILNKQGTEKIGSMGNDGGSKLAKGNSDSLEAKVIDGKMRGRKKSSTANKCIAERQQQEVEISKGKSLWFRDDMLLI